MTPGLLGEEPALELTACLFLLGHMKGFNPWIFCTHKKRSPSLSCSVVLLPSGKTSQCDSSIQQATIDHTFIIIIIQSQGSREVTADLLVNK